MPTIDFDTKLEVGKDTDTFGTSWVIRTPIWIVLDGSRHDTTHPPVRYGKTLDAI